MMYVARCIVAGAAVAALAWLICRLWQPREGEDG